MNFVYNIRAVGDATNSHAADALNKKCVASFAAKWQRFLLLILLICLLAGNKTACAQFVAWNVNACGNGGPPTMSSDSTDLHVVVGELKRGSSLTFSPAGINGFWGAESFSTSSASETAAIALHNYVSFTITPLANCTINLTSIDPCYIYKSDAGAPTTGRWQYSTDNINFINIGATDITWGPNTGAGTNNLQAPINLSGIPALQNVTSANTITFRIVAWGATNSNADWGIGDVSGNALQINFSSTGPASPVIAQWDIYSNTNDFTAPTFSDPNLTLAMLSKITMGPAITVNTNTQGYFLVNGFTSAPISIASNAYLQFQLTVPAGYSMSISSLDMNVYSNINFDASPGMKSQWAYILSGTVSAPLTAIGFPDTTILSTGAGGADNYIYPTVNCSGVTNLQNVPAGTTITLRLFAQGVSASYFGFSFLNNTIVNNIKVPCFGHDGVTFRGMVKQGCSLSTGFISALHDTICQGTTGNLTLSGNSGKSIQWQSSTTAGNFNNINGAIDTAVYFTQPLSQTTYYRVIVGNGVCTDTSQYLRLFVPPALTAYFNFVKSGKAFMFNADSSLGNIISYNWSFGDGTTSNLKNPSHTYTKDTTYNVCLTIYDGSNCSYTYCKDVALSADISSVLVNGNWAIYPNPVGNELFITEEKLNGIKGIEMFDVLGRMVLTKDVKVMPLNSLQLDVSELSTGIYFLRIKTNRFDYLFKVIKQ